jgi:hypothetical protein
MQHRYNHQYAILITSKVAAGGAGGLLKFDKEKAKVTGNSLRYRGYAVLN